MRLDVMTDKSGCGQLSAISRTHPNDRRTEQQGLSIGKGVNDNRPVCVFRRAEVAAVNAAVLKGWVPAQVQQSLKESSGNGSARKLVVCIKPPHAATTCQFLYISARRKVGIIHDA
jgi:hypothetical protein